MTITTKETANGRNADIRGWWYRCLPDEDPYNAEQKFNYRKNRLFAAVETFAPEWRDNPIGFFNAEIIQEALAKKTKK